MPPVAIREVFFCVRGGRTGEDGRGRKRMGEDGRGWAVKQAAGGML